MVDATLLARSRTLVAALAALAAVGTLACRGERPPSDHVARLAQAAARGLPTHLRADWGPGGPRGIACASRMRDASDSAVSLALTTQVVHTETVRRGVRTVVERWSEGEYVVTPAGRYAAAGQGTLRVDCGRGAAIAPPGA